MQNPSVLRSEAVEATLKKFAHKKFEYGKRDCAHLVSYCLTQLGHADPMADIGRYSSRLGAIRALKRSGFSDFPSILDALGFERIAPAFARTGDVVTIPSDDTRLGCLGLRLSGNDVLAYADVAGGVYAALMPFKVADCAWRVTVHG